MPALYTVLSCFKLFLLPLSEPLLFLKIQAMLSQITGCHIFRYASQLVCAYILHMLGSNDLCKCSLPIQLLAHFQHRSLNVIWLLILLSRVTHLVSSSQINTQLSLISVWQTCRIQTNQKQTPAVIQTFKLYFYKYYIYVCIYSLCFVFSSNYFPPMKTMAAVKNRRNILSKLLLQLSNAFGFISAFNHPQKLFFASYVSAFFNHGGINCQILFPFFFYLFGVFFILNYIHFMY